MCLTGCLLELLCSAAEAAEEMDQISSVVQEIQHTPKLSKIVHGHNIESIKNDENTVTASDENNSKTNVGMHAVSEVLSTAIKSNPTVCAITNTLGAIEDFRNGEKVTDIAKERAIKMVEHQVPISILEGAEAELSYKIENK